MVFADIWKIFAGSSLGCWQGFGEFFARPLEDLGREGLDGGLFKILVGSLCGICTGLCRSFLDICRILVFLQGIGGVFVKSLEGL